MVVNCHSVPINAWAKRYEEIPSPGNGRDGHYFFVNFFARSPNYVVLDGKSTANSELHVKLNSLPEGNVGDVGSGAQLVRCGPIVTSNYSFVL